MNFDCELDLSSFGRDVPSDLETSFHAHRGLAFDVFAPPAWMPPTEREILEARLVLDQKGKKKISKTTKARPGKENMLELEAQSKKEQPVAVKCVSLVSFMFHDLIFLFLDGQSLISISWLINLSLVLKRLPGKNLDPCKVGTM